MKAPLKTEASGLENVSVTWRAENPMGDSGGLQHEMDEQVNCAASNSPLTSHPHTPPPNDEKQCNLGKNRLAKSFKELPEREDHPLLPRLKTCGKTGCSWDMWVASIWGHLLHQSTLSEKFGAWGAKVLMIIQNDPKHSTLNEPLEKWRRSCDQVTGWLKCWMKFKVAKWEILHAGLKALFWHCPNLQQTSEQLLLTLVWVLRQKGKIKKVVFNPCNLYFFSCHVGYWFRCWTPGTKYHMASIFPISSKSSFVFSSLMKLPPRPTSWSDFRHCAKMFTCLSF